MTAPKKPLGKDGTPRRRARVPWQEIAPSIDWGRPNGAIAKDFGCSPESAAMARRRYAPETIRAGAGPKKIDWKQIDWSKQNTEIAEHLGCSDQMVSIARARHAKWTLQRRRGPGRPALGKVKLTCRISPEARAFLGDKPGEAIEQIVGKIFPPTKKDC